MENITEEMGVHKQWYEEARNMTPENLNTFITKLVKDYNHDYGTICHAMAAGAIATMYAMDKTPQGGITGFQASCIMWEFIKQWMYKNNKCGMKLLNYDNMLFPQYHDNFDKTISKQTWESLQKQAKMNLDDTDENVHVSVKAHWEDIVAGVVPFGYTVRKDE